MATVADILSKAKLPETRVPICLRGDLLADLEAAEKAAREAAKGQPVDDRLVGGAVDPVDDDPEVQRLRGEIRESVTHFTLRGIGSTTLDAIMLAHPAGDDETDKAVGYNFTEARKAILRASLADPEVTSDEEWQQLQSVLPYGQREELLSAAYQLAAGKVDAPFLRAG